MRFSDLKDFIENTMKMQEGNNYQPAMIKFLINVGGTASKPQILQGLQEENPEREIKKDSVNTVTEVLTNHTVVKDNGDSTFTLLDYQSYSNTERKHIIDLCDKKIIEASTYSSERQNRIVLFSVSGEGSFEHFEDTILKDVDTSTFTDSEMKKFPKVRTWGSINNKYTYPRWEKLQKGDIIIFYRDKKYVAVGILEGTEHNQQVAQSMWGTKADTNQTWELILYMLPENVIESNVDYQELNNLLDYKENFMPTRTLDFTLVRNEVIRKLNDKFGSTENALSSIGFNLKDDSDYKNFEQVTYLSPDQFEKFLNAIPKLEVYHGSYVTQAALRPERMQLLFKVTYYCALRISETLSLHKSDFDLESKILTIRDSKKGTTPSTTIPPKLVEDLKKVWDKLPEKPFDISRQTTWVYAKQAGQLAGVNVFKSQSGRDIEGIWPTIFRDSRAKLMDEKGAREGLIRLKLRLDFDDAIFKVPPKIEELIEWEANEELTTPNLPQESVNYWKISPGENGSDWENQKNKGVIAIHFFDFGDLSNLSEDELREKIRQAYGEELTPAKQANTFGQMRDFMKIKEGDIILANSGKSKILGIGKVKGKYQYQPNEKFPHTFPIDWYDTSERDIPKQEAWMITVIPLSKEEFDSLIGKYLLLMHRQDNDRWQDDLGKLYHTGRIPNYTKLVPGAKTIWFDRKDGQYKFWGYGDISKVEEDDEEFLVKFDDFTFFNEDKTPKTGSESLKQKITTLPGFNQQISMLPITKEIYDEIVYGKVIEVIESLKDEPLPDLTENIIDDGYLKLSEELLIPKEKVIEIVTALASGRHVLLAGPIGTGKTRLAKLIPELFWQRYGGYYSEDHTATADWSTQDVIGGIFPKMNSKNEPIYEIQNGCVVETVQKNWQKGIDGGGRITSIEPKKDPPYRGTWLIIDEFNRADIDKAFGQLFTALRTRVLKIPTSLEGYSYKELKIPLDYRIIGTLNTADKHYLFQLSDALKSRFAYIEVDIPKPDQRETEIYYALKNATSDLQKNYDSLVVLDHQNKKIDAENSNPEFIQRVYQAYHFLDLVRIFKKLGTAILQLVFQNMLTGFTITRDSKITLDNALTSNLIPQLENVSQTAIGAINALYSDKIIDYFKDAFKSPNRQSYADTFSNILHYLDIPSASRLALEFANGTLHVENDSTWKTIQDAYENKKKDHEMQLDQLKQSINELIKSTVV